MEIINLSSQVLALLFIVAIVAGFVDALAGGGGLIALPALVLTGMPPIMALGTNKLQGCAGTATSSWVMFRKKMINWQEAKWLIVAAFIGAVAGTIAVQFVDADALGIVIPVVLAAIALFFLFTPNIGERHRQAKISGGMYCAFVVPVIGWYDGMFGPGTGSFFSLAGVILRGQGLIEATARAKVMNFATNIAALTIFAAHGQVVINAGLAMIAGQLLGAWLGAHSLLRINQRVLRLLIVGMCLTMLARYLYQNI